MRFSKPQKSDHPVDVEIPDNSMLIFSRKSQEDWKHEIVKDESIASTRWSFTLRNIKPHFMNSTLVVGDSNTQNLKFGTSKGCFGAWVPGERLKASRIEDIPEPSKLYPHRNLLLHVGINDSNRHNRESTNVLISQLDVKCKAISQKFTNMKIFVSLLLPTTNFDLNCSINEFNEQLQMLVNSRSYLHATIEHHNLLDNERKLCSDYCRDYLHLNNLRFE